MSVGVFSGFSLPFPNLDLFNTCDAVRDTHAKLLESSYSRRIRCSRTCNWARKKRWVVVAIVMVLAVMLILVVDAGSGDDNGER